MPRSHRLKMQRDSQAQRPRSIVTEGLIVAGATAAAYLLTFAYEYGYCSYFGIPGFLIEPSTGTILFAAIFILVAGVLFIELSHLPRVLLSAIPWPILRLRLTLLALIWGTHTAMGLSFNWLKLLNLSMLTLLLVGTYLYALIFTSGSFAERISKGEKDAELPKSAWDGPKKIFGATAVGSVLIFCFAMNSAFVIGTLHARFQTGFTIVKSTPDLAVVKRYGDRLIAIRYEGRSPQATGEFRVIEKEKDMEFMNLEKLTIQSVRNNMNNKSAN